VNRPSPPPEATKLLEAALDVFVYAPIGFLLDAREVVPKLAERGRGQVTLARLFGRYALQLGQAEAERVLQVNRDRHADDAPAHDAPADVAEPEVVTPDVASNGDETLGDGDGASVDVGTAEAADTADADQTLTAPPVADLPIPGYDTLSASQVVPRLEALLPHELEAVRAYESAHRKRRTILNRIAQRLP
jgi:hypothetical protein